MKAFPKTPPILETQRLKIRIIQEGDASQISKLANDYDVVKYLTSLPHPYTIDVALDWIETSQNGYKENKLISFGIIEKNENVLIGIVGLDANEKNNHGTLGYWLGQEYWSKGYAAEATRTVLQFGFETLEFHRICCGHFHKNPASGKVMQKIGMTYEGTRRQHIKKGDEYLDVVDYGILREDYHGILSATSSSPIKL